MGLKDDYSVPGVNVDAFNEKIKRAFWAMGEHSQWQR